MYGKTLFVCLSLLTTAFAQDAPWPVDVPGFNAPAPGEHPRLFFRKSDLPALRERAKTPEGKAIIARLKVLLGGGEKMPPVSDQTRAYEKKEENPDGTYTVSHAAGFGFLYQLTGEKKYADLGRKCFEIAWEGARDADPEARYSWVAPGGMLRGGPSIAWYAFGYDLCYDGWDENFRKEVAQRIQDYAQQENGKGAEGSGSAITLERLSLKPKHPPGSNHYGAQVGGAAMALLAIRGDEGTDSAKIEKWLAGVEKNLAVQMEKGWGDKGWFAEGDGPSGVAADTALIPAFQAMLVAGGKDFISPRPAVPWMTLKWPMLTLPVSDFKKGKDIFPLHSNTYDHNIYERRGFSGSGHFAQGFGTISEKEKPALLWLYNRVFKDADEAAGTPFDSVSRYPHRAILSFVNWPFDVEEENPATVFAKAEEDKSVGHYMFRNRWQDGDDIIIDALLKGSRGHYSVKPGTIIVWGLGKKTVFPVRVTGDVKFFEATETGGAFSTSLGSFGVDFSGKSGADAVLVLTGPITGTPKGATVAKAGETTYTIMTLQKGEAPEIKAEGDTLKIGGQAVGYDGTAVCFGK